jgi:hypothetical protein
MRETVSSAVTRLVHQKGYWNLSHYADPASVLEVAPQRCLYAKRPRWPDQCSTGSRGSPTCECQPHRTLELGNSKPAITKRAGSEPSRCWLSSTLP